MSDAPPLPSERARRALRGFPVVLADGRAWTLSDATLHRAMDAVRDRIFDGVKLRGRYGHEDVYLAAWLMLLDGYDLSGDELKGLLGGVDADALWPAVRSAFFGPPPEAAHAEGRAARTYSAWVRSALLANGLDPAAVDVRDRAFVLGQLVAAGRAAPPEEWIECYEAAGRLEALLAEAVAGD